MGLREGLAGGIGSKQHNGLSEYEESPCLTATGTQASHKFSQSPGAGTAKKRGLPAFHLTPDPHVRPLVALPLVGAPC